MLYRLKKSKSKKCISMFKSCLLTLVLLVVYSTLCAQKNNLFPFVIKGTVNADTGTVELRLLADPDFYPENTRKFTGVIENRKFIISGHLSSPLGFDVMCAPYLIRGPIIIQAGEQLMNIQIDSNRATVKIHNQITQSEEDDFRNGSKKAKENRAKLGSKWDSLKVVHKGQIPEPILEVLTEELKQSYKENDKALLKIVQSNSNSHLAFWKLIDLLNFGYEPIFDTIYNHFSSPLKNSYSGLVLAEKLKEARALSKGRLFPAFLKVDTQNHSSSTIPLTSKYTLIDFWYSSCSPCIAQFPHLKEIYSLYDRDSFQIIAISTDKLAHKDKWLTSIAKYQLPWPQYWDKNGEEALKYSINAFPTTLLLDAEGRIVLSNVHPVELKKFLKENLK
jgi:thiol-disulfide isomerase/thioredoxin